MTHEPIARIEAALRRLGANLEPPAGWERRVLARTRALQPRRGWWTVPALALAALVAFAAPPARSHALALDVVREPRGPAMRDDPRADDSAHVGDHLRITATGGPGPRALWIYRNEVELITACPGGAGCGADGDAVTVELALAALGRYTIAAVASPTPPPAPTGSYDADLAAAAAAGAATQIRELEVR